ncbi:MAG: thioredoxin domain-containing protein [Nannocystis sp.]|uniref:DsbA family protein n=1 Tax=Nannocystis sp. TaxID=1962667 RepID=UPI002429B1C6|nr:thioredoxin domain-containing protein [Nannocystis sp.]MBK9758337.1 thioredoxin domain-containing protein [Nannocystis sp.]
MSRLVRVRFVASACLLLLSVGCRKPAAAPEQPEASPVASEDAQRLPAFDMSDGSQEPGGVPFERFYVELGDAPVRGPATAPVTIVAFSDFECPYCERGHRTIQQVEREYAGKVRVAYKAFPLDFHSQAMFAALAARSAQDQGKFWEFHDLLFGQRGLDMQQLDTYAREAGLDTARVHADLEALKWGSAVQRDLRQARRLGVTGTPAYFINGRYLSGSKPIEVMREVIDKELELAAGWQASGVAPDKLYAHAIAKGYREVQYSKPRKGLKPDVIYPVPVGSSPQRGLAGAPVTIVEFGDFECQFCARGNDTLEKMRRRYGDKLRVVFKHFPLSFHGHAFLAARAALAAEAEGKFWEFHDRLYQTRADFDEATLVAIARELGLNAKKFKERLYSAEYDAKIIADQELGATLGVRGTPAYFVNGRALDGAVPELEFRLAIQEELERAEALLREGSPAAGLYERLLTPKQPDQSR